MHGSINRSNIINQVSFQDKFLLTKHGFQDRRSVAVLCEEQYYDDDYDSFRIMHLNLPLEGKVLASYIQQIINSTTTSTPIERRTTDEHTYALSKLLGDKSIQRSTLNACAQFVADFNSSYVMIKDFVGDTVSPLSLFLSVLRYGVRSISTL